MHRRPQQAVCHEATRTVDRRRPLVSVSYSGHDFKTPSNEAGFPDTGYHEWLILGVRTAIAIR